MTALTDRLDWLAANGVCTRRDFAGTVIGARCEDCGHANVVHIGADACVVCEMRAELAEFRAWREAG